MNYTQLAVVACLLASWAGALLFRDRFELPRVTQATMKFTHVLPAILQIILFAYWSVYWPGVLEHSSVIAAQLLVAYVFDFLLAWTRRLPYGPSVGPVPIVLSMNLFVWFPPQYMLLGML